MVALQLRSIAVAAVVMLITAAVTFVISVFTFASALSGSVTGVVLTIVLFGGPAACVTLLVPEPRQRDELPVAQRLAEPFIASTPAHRVAVRARDRAGARGWGNERRRGRAGRGRRR